MSGSGLGNIAGRMKTRLVLQQPVNVPDGAGGSTRSWEDLATFWAELIPLSGSERLEAMQLTGQTTHRVRIRYRADMSTDKRFVLADRVFNIRAVFNLNNDNDLFELLVEENAAT